MSETGETGETGEKLLARLRQVRDELEDMQREAAGIAQTLRDKDLDIELKRNEAVTLHRWYFRELEQQAVQDQREQREEQAWVRSR